MLYEYNAVIWEDEEQEEEEESREGVGRRTNVLVSQIFLFVLK